MRSELKRSVSRSGFFALAFGSMIGVGWVTAVGGWLNSAGPLGAILAFVAGGGLILMIGLCYAELCAMLPVSGGEVAYSYAAFGPSKSYAIGSLLAFGYLAVSVFEAISVAKVTGYLIPGIDRWPLYAVGGEVVYGSQLALSLVTTAIITAVNYRGVRAASRFQSGLVVLFAVAAAAFIGAGLVGGRIEHLTPAFGEQTATLGPLRGVAAVFVTAPFWFVGFDTIPQAAEEAEAAIAPGALARLLIASIFGADILTARMTRM
ncbi:MAG: APC family permease [Myxococcota bacterium]